MRSCEHCSHVGSPTDEAGGVHAVDAGSLIRSTRSSRRPIAARAGTFKTSVSWRHPRRSGSTARLLRLAEEFGHPIEIGRPVTAIHEHRDLHGVPTPHGHPSDRFSEHRMRSHLEEAAIPIAK